MNQQNLNRRLEMNIALAIIALLLAATGTFAQTKRANGRIAFDAAGGIWTMNPDGTDQRELTATMKGEQAQLPSWSPDGNQIAFVKFTAGLAEIWVMNSEGTNQSRLTTTAPGPSMPAWSADGSRIAFADKTGLWVIKVDGSDKIYLGAFNSPSWSPDGTHLVVTDGQSLRVIQSDGSGSTLLWSDNNQFDLDWAPAWSPDGSRIAFAHCQNCDDDWDFRITIWTVNSDGTQARMIAGVDEVGLSWAPDGKKLVFSSFSNGYDLYTMNADGSDLINITNTRTRAELDPSWQPLPELPVNNPIDDTQFFVHQQYADFLNREPHSDGQTFWINQIMACSGDPQCVEVQRINDSGAFYLSIEFQQTGYLVYRMYKAAYGNLPNAPVPVGFSDFLADTKEIGQGVEVLQPGWDTTLENNKLAFAADFVQRPRFASTFPDPLTPDQFVDSLNVNAGNPLSQSERDQLVSDLSSGAKSRAQVLRAVAENPNLVKSEFNRAFVLMQYFGYLRRDPNAGPDTDFSGYNFWLDKLNAFNGDFAQAEMVKAFIESGEYRNRFLK